MGFISLGKYGRNGAKYYVWTFLLIITTTIGVGQLPYYLGLMAAGIEFSKVLELTMQFYFFSLLLPIGWGLKFSGMQKKRPF
jgi:hypothetical protein